MGLISETDWRSSSCMKELARLKELQASYHEYLDAKRRYDALNPLTRLFAAEPLCPLGDKETCLGQMRDLAEQFCSLFNAERGLVGLETSDRRAGLSCRLAHSLEERDGLPEVIFDARNLFNDGQVFHHRHETFRSVDGQISSVTGPEYPYSESGVLLELDGDVLRDYPEFSQLFDRFLAARGELQAMLSDGENLTIIKNNNREVLEQQKNLEDKVLVEFRDRMSYEMDRIRGIVFTDRHDVDSCFSTIISLYMVSNGLRENYSTVLCKEAGLPHLADRVREVVHSVSSQMKAVACRSEVERLYMDADRTGRQREESLELLGFERNARKESEDYYKEHDIEDDHLYKSFIRNKSGFGPETSTESDRKRWFSEYQMVSRIVDYTIEHGFLRNTVFNALLSQRFNLQDNPLFNESIHKNYRIIEELLDSRIREAMTDIAYEPLGGSYTLLAGDHFEKPFVATVEDGMPVLVTGIHQGIANLYADGISLRDGSELTGLVLPVSCLFDLNAYLVERKSSVLEELKDSLEEKDGLEESLSEQPGVDWKVEDAVYGYLCSSGDEKSAAEFCSVLKDRGLPEEKVADLLAQTETYRQSLVKGKSEVRGKSVVPKP